MSKTPTTEPTFALNATIVLKPERRDDFLKIIIHDQKQTIGTEPNAIQFVVGEDMDTKNTFYLHEEYKTKADFDHHCNTDHFAKWQKFCEEGPFVSDPVVQLYKLHGNAKKEQIPVKAALCLNVKVQVEPKAREEFLKVIQMNQEGSVDTEALCSQFVFGESLDQRNEFYIHEQYVGKEGGMEGMNAHKLTKHFAAYSKFSWAGNSWTELPVVQKFNSIA